MDSLKEFLAPKTFNRFSFVVNICWILLGVTLSAIFLDAETSESRFDFRCGSNGDKELIRGKCYEQYEKQYHKFGIPVYGFVILNFFLTSSVCVVYSQAVKARVCELEANLQDVENQTQLRIGNQTRKKLFTAYCLQLVARFLLGIIFVLLQTNLLYPRGFPSNFNCNLAKKGNLTNTTVTATECHNQRAAKKTFWSYAVIVVTGTFALLVFIEVLCILWRARRREGFMEDQQFYKHYLKSNSNASSKEPQQQELTEVVTQGDVNRTEQPSTAASSNAPPSSNDTNRNAQTSVGTFQERMKNYIRTVTDRPLCDLKSPFHRNPGEGLGTNLTLDKIYTNLIIHEGRAYLDQLTGDREEQLKKYLRANANLKPKRPADVFDAEKQNILVVGHPGTGKTLFCTKILRDWACDNLFIGEQNEQLDFQVAFLVKLRMLNRIADQELNLRELLEYSEYSTPLSDEPDEVWKYIRQNPNKVLVIFDGFDEYSGRTEIDNDDTLYRNWEEDRMPLHSLLKKILSGKILAGATVLTTTRPTAVSCFGSLCFHKAVEILGFTPQQVEDYVEKFTNDRDRAETIKEHIRSNLNLRSFCYIPVNCFIICSCLLKLLIDNSADHLGCLPTKLTEIYSAAIKILYFCYDDDRYRHHKDKGRDFYLKPFKELPEAVTRVFSRLGEIAFNGIQQGRLVFESQEVNDLETNGLFQRLPDTSSGYEEGKAQYCFLHLTVQEFFAAKHLVDTKGHEELKSFVSDHIKEGAWKVVMQFVAGLLLQEEQSTDIFSGLLPLSSVTRNVSFDISRREELEARTVTCWPAQEDKELVVTLFNCMYENNSSRLEVQSRLAQIDCNALDFSSCRLSPLDCLTLVHALQCNGEKIWHFDLEFNDIAALGCIEISKLFGGKDHNQGFCNLKVLNLSSNSITDEGVKSLTTALINSNCKLNSLGLDDNQITDKGVEYLTTALINSNCKLNSLDLEDNNITDKGVKHLTTALINNNCELNSLSLEDNQITDKGVEYLTTALINSNCKLNSLDLEDNNITDKGVKHLTTALINNNCELNSLSLTLNEVTHKGVEHLTTALINTNCKLNSIGLGGNDIPDKEVKYLTTALTHTNCKLNSLSLNISFGGKPDEGVKYLTTALTHTNCKLNSLSLDISFGGITDKSVKHLTTALTHTNCKLNSLSLNISFGGKPDEGVKYLTTALTHTNCKLNSLSLDISFGGITDKSVKHLTTALTHTNCKLTSLSITAAHSSITDKGVKHLATALTNNNCKLKSLSLPDNLISGVKNRILINDAAKDKNCAVFYR